MSDVERVQETMLGNIHMQEAIVARVFDNSSTLGSTMPSNVFNNLECLLTKLPVCIRNTATDLFVANPEFGWALVGILSTALVIGYTTHKYIECACNIPEIKSFVEELLVDVNKDVKEAGKIVDELGRSIHEPTNVNPVRLLVKIREAETKLDSAEKLLARGKNRVEDALSTFRRNRNIGLAVSGLSLTGLTALSGFVGFIFPPAGLLAVAGTAVRVGLGAAAAFGALNLSIWVTLFLTSLNKITSMKGALLTTWEHYDRASVKQEEVKKRLDDINALIFDLADEDGRIARINGFQAFKTRFAA